MVRSFLAGCLAGLVVTQFLAPSFAARSTPGKLPDCSPRCPLTAAFSSAHKARDVKPSDDNEQLLQNIYDALAVLQDNYYSSINGTWPSSIDWTGAVIETILSGTLSTLTKSFNSTDWKQKENLISSIYAQVAHSYFGQNALAIKGQAYDDILWVVLGWIEAVKFVRLHAQLHYPGTSHSCKHLPRQLSQALQSQAWHGFNWVCTFAGRAREFWDLATNGWDATLCDGGMIWNPRLVPYKNAITNELWISASISMYQHFPNDTFKDSWVESIGFPTKDPLYLAAAVEGYKWLKGVNMTNQQGLFVDGYHIDGNKPNNVRCDVRDEMVYTYNQGVILTGQRGLWATTGSASFLEDGHRLIQSVINATGWDVSANTPIDKVSNLPPGQLLPWRGLGRGGILEEACDASGTCSQDGQTFKGIFFHHLTAFCAPIDAPGVFARNAPFDLRSHAQIQVAHNQACRRYVGWVKHNVKAALETRDPRGRFGMWWGAGAFGRVVVSRFTDGINHNAYNVTDYRNQGTPQNAIWGQGNRWVPGSRSMKMACVDDFMNPVSDHRELGDMRIWGLEAKEMPKREDDPNNRGRGRTVETQAGGLALLRAYYELSQLR
ncbi:hypothetical protein HIM_04599 [Hirsutella minnesotensis 3608]|uniref:Glycosyl hydrolase n=1 Tax=Hirsutella minnesotensis 3608 TaxID=1043627 RepID=A0A0F7ZV79_9HYPO|nr:hypothetical protein HIM_04599 [Hirsutella minnesotensis 3608]